LRVVLSESVRPYVWLYYVPIWFWGVYGTFFAAPATYVKPVMGQDVYDLWIWLCLVGTTVVMVGLYLEHKAMGDEVTRRGDLVAPLDTLGRIGIRFQAAGHACMFCVLLAYWLSTIYVTDWGEGTFTIFLIAPYVVACVLLTVQGIAKVLVAEKNKGGDS
jgi:hypothetical protein